jgi:biopolymer transport protein ExbD
MLSRLSLTSRIRLATLLVPIAMLGDWAGWSFTRSWRPVDMPISFARGHIQAEFDINVESVYKVNLQLNPERREQRPPCPNGPLTCDPVRSAGVHWSVSDGRHIVAGGENDATGATFDCHTGHYVFGLDIPEDQRWLDFYEPRLVIFEAGGKFNSQGFLMTGALFLLALFLCGPVGACMLVLAGIHRRQEKFATFLKAHPLTQAGPAGNGFRACSIKTEPFRRLRPKPSTARPLSRLSAHSLVILVTFLMVWIVFAAITPLSPHGLRVHLIGPGVTTLRSPGIQPLLLYVDKSGIFLGAGRLSLDALPSRLEQELSRRPPDWPVYIQGDPNLEWRQVAEAIDAIRASGADVVLLPHSKGSK